MSEIKEISEVVSLFCDAVKKYGKKKIMKSVSEIHSQSIEEKNIAVIDYIILQSCQFYGIKKDEILKKRVSSDYMDAKNLAIILIKKHTKLSHQKIAEFFKSKARSEISIAISSFKNKNSRYKPDADFLRFYAEIDEKVDRFKLFF